VNLVQNNAVVIGQLLRVVDEIVKEYTNGNEGYSSLFGYTGICSYVVANELSDVCLELSRDLSGYVDASDSSWLGAEYSQFGLEIVIENDRKLSALSAASVPLYNEALIAII
jgi:hypothetical protein